MLAGLTLAALLLAGALAGRFGRPAAPALGALSVLWLLANGPMEGSVLLRVSPGHGLTAADLAGVVGILLALILLARPCK
jgi:uncharacterized membrane protein HdeD (DUF308 family)